MAHVQPAAPTDLAQVIVGYRLRYEVVREAAPVAGVRRAAGLEVWVWATLARGAASLPGSPECRQAVRAVTRGAPDPRLRELTGRLERLGVFEGRWRPLPPPAADPWAVRPAAEAFTQGGPGEIRPAATRAAVPAPGPGLRLAGAAA
jgi:hypothetical protein